MIPGQCRIAALMLFTAAAAAGEAAPRPTIQDELKNSFFPIVRFINSYYMYEVSPDTLMQAGLRGIFQALDPSSEFAISGSEEDWQRNFSTFERAVRVVDKKAFYAVGPDTLIGLGIDGMMSVLDPDTVFMEKLTLDNFRINTRGEYGGLGFRIQVVYPDSAIAVWSLLHDETPAARSGVRSGDLIIAIDGESTRAMDASEAATLMRGTVDTDVTLTLRRPGREEPFDITVTRQVVHINSVPYHVMFPDSTGYIKLSGFQHKSSQEVRAALADLLDQGMQRLIFDLRSNGGGYLTEAVQVADLFLPPDRLVVYTAGRAFQDTTRYVTTEEAMFGDGPLIILVDGASASASEIVSGSIQDWDRGLVFGTPTVGKGSVQQTVSIGERAELKLTMAAYFIPSGRSIDKRMRKDSTLVKMADQEYRTLVLGRRVHGAGGITPDITMERRRSSRLYVQLSGWGRRGTPFFNNSRFFRFARRYPVDHPELTPDFVADEGTLQAFRAFADADGFEYMSDLETKLDELRQEVGDEGAHAAEALDGSLKQVESEIDQIEEHHWEENAELLTWKLTFDIREKAFGVEQAHAYDVTVDPQVLRAREILGAAGDYQAWFERSEVGGTPAIAAATDTAAVEGEGLVMDDALLQESRPEREAGGD